MSTGLIPEQIHRYRILSELGRGSMGRVLLAQDPHIDREIALKVILERELCEAGQEEQIRERFLREARLAGRLSHPGIVTVYDADTDPESGRLYLAMERVRGDSLRRILDRRGRLETREAAEIAQQVARALAYAHRQGVIHRDVKPANVLVGHEGDTKVTDFGIAKLSSEAVTQTGSVVGSPLYMSPEQLRGLPMDGRSDLFSLAAVLYECLTGRPAFNGSSIAAVSLKVLETEPPPISTLAPETPAALVRVVERMLAKDPATRLQTGDELAEALAAAMTSAPAVVEAVDPTRETQVLPAVDRRRRLLPTVLLVGLTLVGVWWLSAATWLPRRPSLDEIMVEMEAEPAAPETESEPPAPGSIEAREPPPKPAPPPPPAPVLPPIEAMIVEEQTQLVIVYKNLLPETQLSVWLDGELLTRERIVGRGEERRLSLPVSQGSHRLEVEVSGRQGRLEVGDTLPVSFGAEPFHLRVKLQPMKRRLRLVVL